MDQKLLNWVSFFKLLSHIEKNSIHKLRDISRHEREGCVGSGQFKANIHNIIRKK